MGLIYIPFLKRPKGPIREEGARPGQPAAGTACGEELGKMGSTKLREITLIIRMSPLCCSSSILLSQVESECALGTYLSKNNVFGSAKMDLGAERTFCSQGGLPTTPKGSSVTAVPRHKQTQLPVPDLQRSLADLCE